MNKRFTPAVSLAMVALFAIPSARCDFSYNLSSRSTGLMAAMMAQLMPTDAHVAIRGGQMLTASRTKVTIWDVDKATVTEIDLEKKTYSVTPFSEITEGIQRLFQLQFRQAGVDPEQLTAKIDVCTSETGNVRKTSGVESREVHVVVTMDIKVEKLSSSISMVAEGHTWLGPEQNGHEEQLKFNRKRWDLLGWDKNPKSRGFDVLYLLAVVDKEIDGLRGTPISEDTQLRVSLLAAGSGKSQTTGNVLFEVNSEFGAFSEAPVNPSEFLVPKDFQKVQSEILRELPD